MVIKILSDHRHLSGCNWTWTQNHLVHKWTLNHLVKWLSVRLQTKWYWVRVQLQSLKLQILCLLQARSWHSDNYRVWIHSERHTWHDKNIQSPQWILVKSSKLVFCLRLDFFSLNINWIVHIHRETPKHLCTIFKIVIWAKMLIFWWLSPLFLSSKYIIYKCKKI